MNIQQKVLIISLIIFFQNILLTQSLRNMQINVPRAVRAGHSVTLGCEYDLQDAALYSVRWYREDIEFYRFVPKEEPPIRVFPHLTIAVDEASSNANNLTLISVGREISGKFQCEVSADAPSFFTQVLSAQMTIAVVPVGVPLVTIDKSGLEHGKPLIADCHAPPSFPAGNVTFFVNDEIVPGYTSEWTTLTQNDQLEEKCARLELSGIGGNWENLRIRCDINLFKLFRAHSLEIEIKPDTFLPNSELLLETTSSKGATNKIPIIWIVILVVFKSIFQLNFF